MKLACFSTVLVLLFSMGTVSAQEDYNETVMHHISNANEFHIVGDIHMPLPCILYAPDNGVKVFLSSKFHHGSMAYEGYVLDHGVVKRIKGLENPSQEIHLEPAPHHSDNSHDETHGDDAHEGEHHGDEDHTEHGDERGSNDAPAHDGEAHDGGHDVHYVFTDSVEVDSQMVEKSFVMIGGQRYELEKSSTLLGFTSWYDFSISKNVFSMLLATILLFLVFGTVSRGYKKRDGQAPRGLQSFIEPIIIFIRDEVAIPAIGPKWEKFFPFILSVFFFILVNNLFGLIPFFPFSSNVTGNVSTTMALAFFVFLVTNFNGNKHYWEHVVWMPGIPTFVKPILSVIEILGLFIRPFTLFIRLFANITAGHIIILSLVGLIWTFGDMGQNMGGSVAGAIVSFVFVGFMNLLELLVSFLQAFIFALLAALYIGSAVEEHHHEEHAH